MGKRSEFPRRKNDDYPTPFEAVGPLIPFLGDIYTFYEPCCGEGKLIDHLQSYGLLCMGWNDITRKGGVDMADLHPEQMSWIMYFSNPDAIITNPPWSRHLLHPMIKHFQQIAQTWLLFDADWAHTKQARPFLPNCSHIVSVGRVKWIPDSPHTGKDNCAWYRFDKNHTEGPRFYNQQLEAAE